MNISSVFEKIAMSSKSTDKKALVLQERSELMDTIFNDTYNQKIVYGVTSNTINITTSGNATIDINYNTFHDLLVELSKRNLTGNAAIETINELINQFREIDQKILVNILDRNLKIGVSYTNYRKWCGIKDDDYKVALAYTLSEVKGVNPIDGTFYASHKLDGVRLNVHIDMDERKVVYKSRKGREYTTLSNLTEHILKVMEGKEGSWVMDGECCKILPNGEDDFNGLMKEVTRKNYTIADPHYRIFDLVTKEEFDGEVKSENFDKRYEMLCNLPKDSNIKVLEQELITSQEIFDKWAARVEKFNWEGFMLRKNAPYRSGRTKDLLKYKPYEDAEFKVVDVIVGKQTFAVAGEGNKEFDGVSALVIKHKGCDVRVGGGLTKEQRIEWFNDPSLIIGKTITVKYLEETRDKEGNWSLRHPTLKYVYDEERWT